LIKTQLNKKAKILKVYRRLRCNQRSLLPFPRSGKMIIK